MPHMQVAVGLGRKARVHPALVETSGEVVFDLGPDKIRFFEFEVVAHGGSSLSGY